MPADQQQQGGAGAVPGEHDPHVDGDVAVHPMVVGPHPREQQQRRHDLERGDRHEHREQAANEDAGVRGLGRRSGRDLPISGCVTAREDLREHAQVVEHAALGGCCESRAPVPLDTLVQRHGVRYVDEEIVSIVVPHR